MNENPDTKPDPTNDSSAMNSPLKNPQKRKLVLIGGAVAAVLIIAGLFSLTLTNSKSNQSKQTSTASSQNKFANQLAPKSEIKLGDYRYKSPCQVMTLDDYDSVFGGVNGDARYIENSIDRSYSVEESTEKYSGFETYCGYVLNGASIKYLRATQYANKENLANVSEIFSSQPTTLQKTIDAAKKTVGSSGDSDAQELITRMEKSLDTFKKYEDNFEGNTPPSTFNGMILPDGFDAITMFQDNTLYKIDFGIDPKNASADDLAKLNKALKLIKQHATDMTLSQAPAPTILGTSDMAGPTKILEPCVVLSAANFKAVTGLDENDVVDRTTMPANVSKDIMKENKRQPLGNSCTRTNDSDPIKIKVELRLFYSKNVQQAQKYMSDYDDSPSDQPNVPLQTSADEAIQLGAVSGSTPTRMFRVGNTVGFVSIVTYNSDDVDGKFSGDGTQEQYINAINLAVAGMKQQQ